MAHFVQAVFLRLFKFATVIERVVFEKKPDFVARVYEVTVVKLRLLRC